VSRWIRKTNARQNIAVKHAVQHGKLTSDDYENGSPITAYYCFLCAPATGSPRNRPSPSAIGWQSNAGSSSSPGAAAGPSPAFVRRFAHWFLPDPRQSLQQQRPVPVSLENGLAPVATVQDVINSAAIFEAEFSGHGAAFAPKRAGGQLKMGLCGGHLSIMGDSFTISSPTTFSLMNRSLTIDPLAARSTPARKSREQILPSAIQSPSKPKNGAEARVDVAGFNLLQGPGMKVRHFREFLLGKPLLPAQVSQGFPE
jgi:hypothetical protein